MSLLLLPLWPASPSSTHWVKSLQQRSPACGERYHDWMYSRPVLFQDEFHQD